MIRKVIRIFAVLILLAGAALLAFPLVNEVAYDRQAQNVIEDYEEKTKDLYLPELRALMEEYNEDLFENGQADFKDAWSYQPASFDLTEWGFEDNMIGYLDIPAMDVKLPVYLGATVDNMAKGAVHLTETSLPIGGENTNCVIAAHRGFWGKPMFIDIEKLKAGDEITFTNIWETLTYRVAETKVIRPNEVDQVKIQPGRDLITLITCHPLGHNYQRYVVYCERVADAQS